MRQLINIRPLPVAGPTGKLKRRKRSAAIKLKDTPP
jgi:hypothetical protein